TGFDGDDAAIDERSSGGRSHPGVLMDVEADTMAGAVAEGLCPTRFGDDVTADRVDISCRDSSPNGGDTCRLGFDHRVVHALLSRCGLTDHDRPGHVGVIAVHECSEVEHDEVPCGEV